MARPRNMDLLLQLPLVLTLTVVCLVQPSLARMNVLFLVVDDLRPQLGVYYGPDFPSPVHPNMHTPYLDKLAKSSLLLKRAYVQQAVCSPSRTSLLTGRRPDTTRTHDLYHYFRKIAGNFTTLPQYFKENGYQSIGLGKVFHPGHTSGNDDPISWSVPYWHPDASHWYKDMGVSWNIADDAEVREHPLEDMQSANKTIEHLEQLAARKAHSDQPFFLAAGFRRPHLPFLCPKKFYDLYPRDQIRLPPNRYSPVGMPEIAWADNAELRQYRDLVDHKWYGAINQTLSDDVTINLRRAYYACVSYTDSLIGEILEALERLGLAGNTIVAFWSDHGWQLGENAEWSKSSNFELATHSPMMLRIPGKTDHGIVAEQITEFVDLYPTLVEAAGLPSIPLCPKQSLDIAKCTEGFSMMPLIDDPSRPWKRAAFSQYPRFYIGGDMIMGYSMRTDRYRYTEWQGYDGPRFITKGNIHMNSVELYDHKVDPDESYNFAFHKDYKSVQEELHQQLHSGWRDALPKPLN